MGIGAAFGPLGMVGESATKQSGGVKNLLLGQDAPRPELTDLDDKSKALIDQQMANANQTDEQIVGKQMAGTQDAASLMNPDAAMSQNKSLAMHSDNDIRGALQGRALRSFESGNIALKNKAKMEAAGQRQKMMAAAQGSANAMEAINKNAFATNLKDIYNRKVIRNQTLGSILGAAGAGVGFMAGGPGGAKAGASTGKGMAGPQELDASNQQDFSGVA